jgi:hypothetical protein
MKGRQEGRKCSSFLGQRGVVLSSAFKATVSFFSVFASRAASSWSSSRSRFCDVSVREQPLVRLLSHRKGSVREQPLRPNFSEGPALCFFSIT